jgi:hypothetical protein
MLPFMMPGRSGQNWGQQPQQPAPRPAWGGWGWYGWGLDRGGGSGSRPDPRHPLKGLENAPRPKAGQSFGMQAVQAMTPKAPQSPAAAMFQAPRKA